MRVFYNQQVLNLTNQDFKLPDWIQLIFNTIRQWPDLQELQIKTSGSTGIPKKINISKESMISSASLTAQYFDLKKGDRVVLCLPAQYIAGIMMIVRSIVRDFDLVLIEPQSNPLQYLKEKVQFVALTPMQMQLAFDECPDKFNLIEKIIVGGGPISLELHQQIQNIDTDVYHTYGMTETITHIAIRPLNGAQISSSFQALPGVIFQQSAKRTLIISADHLPISPIVTNDIIELLSPNSFIWKGRIDNVINSGGVKMYPEHLENKIRRYIQHPFFISGINDAVLGEKVVLLIEGERIQGLIEELQIVINSNFMPIERPKEILFISEFIYTPTGKIVRDLNNYILK